MAVIGERCFMLPDGVVTVWHLPAGCNNAMLASKTLNIFCVQVNVRVCHVFASAAQWVKVLP